MQILLLKLDKFVSFWPSTCKYSDLKILFQDADNKGKDPANDGMKTDGHLTPSVKETENSKPESPFSTLVKMTTGKNPTTFSLPPELKCNTFFPG